MQGNLILLRHGQSLYNAQGLFTGLHDPDLSPLGYQQAKQCARFLARRFRIDFLIHSALTRAVQTARSIHPYLASPAVLLPADKRLNERDYGDLSGLSKQLVAQRYGTDTLQSWRRGYYEQPPGGESLAQTRTRVSSCFKDCISPLLQTGKNVLVVAHGNSLRALLMQLLMISESNISRLEIGCCSPWAIQRLGCRWMVSYKHNDNCSMANYFPENSGIITTII